VQLVQKYFYCPFLTPTPTPTPNPYPNYMTPTPTPTLPLTRYGISTEMAHHLCTTYGSTAFAVCELSRPTGATSGVHRFGKELVKGFPFMEEEVGTHYVPTMCLPCAYHVPTMCLPCAYHGLAMGLLWAYPYGLTPMGLPLWAYPYGLTPMGLPLWAWRAPL
jgi:hypothetical protein